jgi:hypothetical protein
MSYLRTSTGGRQYCRGWHHECTGLLMKQGEILLGMVLTMSAMLIPTAPATHAA